MTFRVQYGEKGVPTIRARGWSPELGRELWAGRVRRLAIDVEGADVSFLAELPELEMLNLTVHAPRDLRPLEGVAVQELSLQLPSARRRLASPVDFRRIRGLVHLGVDWVEGLGPIQGGPQLGRVVVTRAQSVDERTLGELPGLQTLWLNTCRKIESLECLERYQGIQELSAYSLPRLGSLAGVERLPRLQHLDVESCRGVGDLVAVGGCRALTVLGVKNCGEVASLQPLRSLRGLQRFLAWESTRIVDGDLSPLLELPELRFVALKSRREYRPSVAEVKAVIEAREG